MSDPIAGGCLCGQLRFRINDDVGGAGYCHCTDCRHVTGSAFNVSVAAEAADFEIVSGTRKGFTKRADSGNELTRYFCADCGSPLYTASPLQPDAVFIKAGAFDDPAVVKPSHQHWHGSAVAWHEIDPELPVFEKGRD